jgi:hypothetical protein
MIKLDLKWSQKAPLHYQKKFNFIATERKSTFLVRLIYCISIKYEL